MIDLQDLIAQLRSNIDKLVVELLPGGVIEGHEWRVGSVEGEPGHSLGVHLRGAKAGVWCDFSTGETGDALDLIAAVACGGDKKRAVRWARDWLGHGAPVRPERAKRAAAAKRARSGAGGADNQARAFAIWYAAQPRLAGTPADAYLRGRGIDLRRLLGKDSRPRQPAALRYASALYNSEVRATLPGLVAAITGPDGRIQAIHRIWLRNLGLGRWAKAELKSPKMSLGPAAGGAVRLWRGAGFKSLKDAPAGSELTLCDGIEDGLSLALTCPERRIWVCPQGGMTRLILPPQIGRVTISADNDENEDAVRGLARARDALLAQGRPVAIVHPPKGFKDMNEVLQRAQRGA